MLDAAKTMRGLMAPFPVSQVHWRVGATNGSKGLALAYVDARDVMRRLDTVCGVFWQSRYPFPGCCEIGILVNDEWIWRANGAGETQVEGEKGQFSDAFKRAAVCFGVARYLYYLPSQWCDLENGRIVNPPALPEWATPENFERKNG